MWCRQVNNELSQSIRNVHTFWQSNVGLPRKNVKFARSNRACCVCFFPVKSEFYGWKPKSFMFQSIEMFFIVFLLTEMGRERCVNKRKISRIACFKFYLYCQTKYVLCKLKSPLFSLSLSFMVKRFSTVHQENIYRYHTASKQTTISQYPKR